MAYEEGELEARMDLIAPRDRDDPCTDEYFEDYMHSMQSSIARYKENLIELDFLLLGEQNPVVYHSLSNAIEDLRGLIARTQEDYDNIPKVYVISNNEPIDLLYRVDHGATGRDTKERASYFVDCHELRFISGRVLSDDEYIKSSADLILSPSERSPSERYAYASTYQPPV